jgi:hypothetical protein
MYQQTTKGKHAFYPLAEQTLTANGYTYFDGDRDIKGKGRAHRRRPDYIAVKGSIVVIGETKSPNEPPTSSSWRQKQPNDSQAMASVRANVVAREKAGQLDPNVGGHVIIILGQIPDYVANIGTTFELPKDCLGKTIIGGYTVEYGQAANVESALRVTGRKEIEKIDTANGAVTYLFEM